MTRVVSTHPQFFIQEQSLGKFSPLRLTVNTKTRSLRHSGRGAQGQASPPVYDVGRECAGRAERDRASVAASCDAPSALEAGEHGLVLWCWRSSSAPCGIWTLRPMQATMHGEIPILIRPLRNQSARTSGLEPMAPRGLDMPTQPRPAENEGSNALAPMVSEVWPADRNIRIERPLASARTCNFGFSPPFVRRVSRPRSQDAHLFHG